MRAVFDTNVLIDGFADAFHPAAQLIDAVQKGELTAVFTAATAKEYRRLVRRVVQDEAWQEHIAEFMAAAEQVHPAPATVVIDDREDVKFIEAAVGGTADVIVTSDRHLLDVGEVDNVAIVTPAEALRRFNEDQGTGGEWRQWAEGLGLT